MRLSESHLASDLFSHAKIAGWLAAKVEGKMKRVGSKDRLESSLDQLVIIFFMFYLCSKYLLEEDTVRFEATDNMVMQVPGGAIESVIIWAFVGFYCVWVWYINRSM